MAEPHRTKSRVHKPTKDEMMVVGGHEKYMGETIVIERHMRVGEVHEDPQSTESMLATAFAVVAEAMSENDGEHDRIEFTYGERRFRFALDPVEKDATAISEQDMVMRLRDAGYDVTKY